ncbi:MAG: MFS transporter [Cardiobacterium hominis]
MPSCRGCRGMPAASPSPATYGACSMTDARQPWQRGVAILTAIYITRMLGLFMIFPVFSLYANELAGANKTLVGIALGIYGLSQGLLQIPCGWLSDRYGRKPVIAGGLALFTAGSLLAACASNIEMMIAARAVQGMGAIAAVALAYATDITPPDKLGKTMTILGASIGIAFVLSLILGPLLAGWVGVAGLFLIIALMAAGDNGFAPVAVGEPAAGDLQQPLA